MAAFTSFMMCFTDVAIVGLVVKAGWTIMIPSGLGGACGVFLSMHLYPRELSKKVNPFDGYTPGQPPKDTLRPSDYLQRGDPFGQG